MGREKCFTSSLREKRFKAKAETWDGGKSQSEPSVVTRDDEASLARGRRGSTGIPRLLGGRLPAGVHPRNARGNPARRSREVKPTRNRATFTWATFVPAVPRSELRTAVVVWHGRANAEDGTSACTATRKARMIHRVFNLLRLKSLKLLQRPFMFSLTVAASESFPDILEVLRTTFCHPRVERRPSEGRREYG